MVVHAYTVTAAFIVLDLITGLVKAFKNKAYTSTVMREGLFHKCASILCIVLGVLVDYAQTIIDLGFSVPVATGICVYICLMEMGSIAENLGEINPDLMPDKIREHFKKLGDK